MATKNNSWSSGGGSAALPLTVFAHLAFVAIFTLLLVWLLHFRGGVAFSSDNKQQLFNIHPLLMVIGFVLLSGEAMMAYKSNKAERRKQKIIHGLLHLIAMVSGIIGIAAVFKYHNDLHLPHIYTLHSWFGISTLCLFVLQFVLGLATFVFPRGDTPTKAKLSPWHVLMGLTIFSLGIVSSITGLTEKFTFSGLKRSQEALVINFIGLLIFLFGASVFFTLLQRYR